MSRAKWNRAVARVRGYATRLRYARAIVLTLSLLAFASPALAADIAGATSVALSFSPSSGPVAGYHLFFQYDGEAAPGQLIASLPPSQREVLVGASPGEQIVIRIRPYAANGAVGPFSPPSEAIYFVPQQGLNPQLHEAHDSIATLFVPFARSNVVTFQAYRNDRSVVGLFNVSKGQLDKVDPLIEARVARCDLNGDGTFEFVFGFGDGSDGRVEIHAGHANNFDLIDTLVVGDAAFHAASGGTYPACGDADGDGSDELLVGRGPGGGGIVDIFDDQNRNFAAYGSILLDWPEYVAANGETHPALGDLDGDGRDEVTVGLGVGGENFVAVRDDMRKGFGALWSPDGTPGWLQIDAPLADGSTFPSVAQLDQDAQAELVVGLGAGSASRLYVFDDARRDRVADFPFLPFKFASGPGWIDASWAPYSASNGTSIPAAIDSDSDGIDELMIGHGEGGQQTLLVLTQGQFGPTLNGSFFLEEALWKSILSGPAIAR